MTDTKNPAPTLTPEPSIREFRPPHEVRRPPQTSQSDAEIEAAARARVQRHLSLHLTLAKL